MQGPDRRRVGAANEAQPADYLTGGQAGQEPQGETNQTRPYQTRPAQVCRAITVLVTLVHYVVYRVVHVCVVLFRHENDGRGKLLQSAISTSEVCIICSL